MDINTNKRSLFTLDNVAYGIIAVVVFFLPFFFLPFLGIAPDAAKIHLLQIGIVLAFIIWLSVSLREGTISFAKTIVFAALALVPLASLVSGIFSGQARVSMLGSGTEISTFLGSILFFLLTILAANYFREIKRISFLYRGLFFGALIIVLFQTARFIGGPDFLSLGLFGNPTDNILGKWNDLGLFFGAIALLSVFSLQFLSPGGFKKWSLYAALIASVTFLAIINFSLAWILLGIFSLAAFVYGLSFGVANMSGTDAPRGRLPLLPLIVAIVAIIFLLPGDFFTNAIAAKLNIQHIEVRPSWSATYDITKATLKEDPFLGVGPNRFANQWLLEKPAGVNETLFWNSDFNFGIGVISSSVVTMGLFGLAAWLIFFLVFLYVGGRGALLQYDTARDRFYAFSSFFMALYFWIAAIFYVPGVVLYAFAFLFTGVCIAFLTRTRSVAVGTLSFANNPRIGFLSVLVIIILIITSVVGVYMLGQRLASAYLFGKGITAANVSGDVAYAEKLVGRASGLYANDMYYRTLSDVQIVRLGAVLSQKDLKQDTIRAQFQEVLGNAIGNARAAVDFDQSNYLNWLALGRVYEAVVPLGIEGAYENADAAYKEALARNPEGPAIQVVLARLELAKGDTARARGYLASALQKKTNYTEAIFLLSQIEASAGNIREAITQAEHASLIAPNDVGIFFQLGFLRYKNDDYNGAISALERAVTLNPVYANAKYFLGLSYAKVGRQGDAIAQFDGIAALNPDNSEVRNILNNLNVGDDPFADIAPPLPDERKEPPIKE